MKLNWLVTVALGVALAGCGEVAPQTVADSAQEAPALSKDISPMDEVDPPREVAVEGVSAMSVICHQNGYINGACGCDTGTSCGYTKTHYVRYGQCEVRCSSGNCTWDAWEPIGTSCIASSTCTFC